MQPSGLPKVLGNSWWWSSFHRRTSCGNAVVRFGCSHATTTVRKRRVRCGKWFLFFSDAVLFNTLRNDFKCNTRRGVAFLESSTLAEHRWLGAKTIGAALIHANPASPCDVRCDIGYIGSRSCHLLQGRRWIFAETGVDRRTFCVRHPVSVSFRHGKKFVERGPIPS